MSTAAAVGLAFGREGVGGALCRPATPGGGGEARPGRRFLPLPPLPGAEALAGLGGALPCQGNLFLIAGLIK